MKIKKSFRAKIPTQMEKEISLSLILTKFASSKRFIYFDVRVEDELKYYVFLFPFLHHADIT